ncbi:MAG: hypothetical protein ACK41V_16075 [Acidovorax sp.]
MPGAVGDEIDHAAQGTVRIDVAEAALQRLRAGSDAQNSSQNGR